MILRRKILLFVAVAGISLSSYAQAGSFESLYKRYSKADGVQSVSVGKTKLAIARSVSKDIPDGLKGLKTIIVEDRKATPGADALDADMQNMTAGRQYSIVSETTQQGHSVKVYTQVHGDGNKLKDVIVYVTGGVTIMAIELIGEFDRDDKFIKSIAEGKTGKK